MIYSHPDSSPPPPPPPPPSMTENQSESQSVTLIPGLPNDVGALILSMVPFSHHARIKQTCKSWKQVLSSKPFFSSLLLRRRRNHLLCIFPQDPSIASPFLFDPNNLAWCPLPPMPCNPQVYGLCNFAAVPLGHHLYVLGGSLFDTRSFPIDRPSPSSSTFRLSLRDFTWSPRAQMLSPRGSFACAVVPRAGQILVAGGGSRHTMFAAAGTRIRAAERYDVRRDRWFPVEGLPGFRAGCVGFVGGGGREFWVMGGYGASRTISGVFPVDEYYRDAVVMELEEGGGGGGGRWREVGDMWGDGGRVRAGKIVVVEENDDDGGGDGDDDGSGGYPSVYMLDGNEILRYDMVSNRWLFESRVPRKAPYNPSFGFVAVNGELYVLTHLCVVDLTETRRSRHHKRGGTLFIQIYNPKKKAWRSLVTKSPFNYPIDINSAVLSSIRL